MKKEFIIYKALFINILILTLYSCTPKPLDIKLEQQEPRLVVSSQIFPNSIMIVSVTKSFGALDYSDEDTTNNQDFMNQIFVNNAIVNITYDGITDQLFAIPNAPGFYASISTPQITKKEYKLDIYDPETQLTAKSSSIMMEQVKFDTVWSERSNEGDSIDVKVHVEFTDPADELNWYVLNFYAVNNDTLSQGGKLYNRTADEVTVLLDDASFNGGKFIGDKTMYQWSSDTIIASISNISQGYYNYLLARKKGGDFISQTLGEPINYPSNIEGGYGFFTTHFPDIRVIEVKQ
jgi:hypothetical protein